MQFKSYDKVERIEKEECSGILDGFVFIQEKIDGANASIFVDGAYICGCSRNNVVVKYNISTGDVSGDFRGFGKWIADNAKSLISFFAKHSNIRVFGEWLVKHKVAYSPEHMNKFYAFDFENEKGTIARTVSAHDDWVLIGLPFVPVHTILEDPTIGDVSFVLENMTPNFGSKFVEGIVIKNYEFKNKWGRTVYGKMLHKDFQEVKHKPKKETGQIELSIAEEYGQHWRVEKCFAKITDGTIRKPDGPKEKLVPFLLELVWRDILTEDIMDIMKRYKNPTIDFKALKTALFGKIRVKVLALVDEMCYDSSKPEEKGESGE